MSDGGEKPINVTLTVDEFRFIIRCGMALALNVPKDVLPTYSGFDIEEIKDFTRKMRLVLDENGYDM